MSSYDGTSSHFSLWQNQPGLVRGSAGDPADDHRSICSADSRNASRSPLNAGEVGVVTPAQAYASAVKTGETHDRALYYIIERRQPERKGRSDQLFVPSHLGDPGPPDRGLSFAQRLYASATSNKPSTLPSSNIPVLPPIKTAPSSVLPMGGGSQTSCGVPHHKTSLSASLFDTGAEVPQPFSPSDLYHNSVVMHGFPSQASTSPGVSTTRRSSLLPVSHIPNPLPVTRLSYQANLRATHSLLQNQPKIQSPPPVLHQSQAISIEAQSYSNREASGLQGVSVETHQGLHLPAVASTASTLPSLLEQQPVIPPSFSPPPFEEHERLSNPSEEAVAEVLPVVIGPPGAVPHEGGLPDGYHEEVPLYSLVDEQLPPPAFDDLQTTSAPEASTERSLALPCELLPQEGLEARSSPSPPPSHSPPPFSHGSTPYAPEKAPAYALPDKISHSAGTSKNVLQDTKTSLSSITIWRPSDPSPSDPTTSVPTGLQRPNQSPPLSPPISPSIAVPQDVSVIQTMPPLLSSDSRPRSVLSPRYPDTQSIRTSCEPLAIRKSANSSPPLVNYHTKPTTKQNGQSSLPPPALPSGSRPPEGSNTLRQRRGDPRSLVNVAEDNDATDALTRSMSDMGRPSSDPYSLAYENSSSNRQNVLGTLVGSQQNIPNILASHPSGTLRTIGSLNQEPSTPEAERLIQEAHRRPTHAETSGRAGYGIQGLGSANPPAVTNISTSQHSSRGIPSLGPIPPVYSHEELQTETVCTAGGGSIISHGETAVLSSGRPPYADRPHVASVLSGRSFPYPIQPSYHSIDQDIHGSVPPPGPIPPQQQNANFPGHLDPMKRGSYVFPPPPPPPIAPQPWNTSQPPQTSSYSQDNARNEFGPGIKAPALNSNDLARKFANDALLAPSGGPTYAFYGTNHR